MESSLQSAQSFIRALKSNSDPPYANGPLKIAIARAGWESKTLYLPRKAGVILEWLLPSMYKEHKDESNPRLMDLAYWDLLADILKNPDDTQIETIISRFPVYVWIKTFLATYAAASSESREQLLDKFTHILDIIWPTLIQRAGLDALTQCLGCSLDVMSEARNKDLGENLSAVLNQVLSGFSHSFANSNATARKKAYGLFYQHYFLPWLRTLSVLTITHPLGRRFYDIGIDVLFNQDSLRVALENNPTSKADTSIFSVIFNTSIKSDPVTRTSFIQILPRLFKAYTSALRHHRSAIFTGNALETQPRERMLQMTNMFFGKAWGFLESLKEVEHAHVIWKTMRDIIQVVEEESLFGSANSQWLLELLKRLSEEASDLLSYIWDDSQSTLTAHALDILSCLHRVEPDLVDSLVPRILQCIVTASSSLHPLAGKFLTQLISYHSKMRTLPTLVSLIFSALSTPCSHVPHAGSLEIYHLCACSPFLSITFVNELTQALGQFMTPGQAHELVILSISMVSKSLEQISQSLPQKRMKLASRNATMAADTTHNESIAVISFSLISRFATPILLTLMSNQMRKDPAEARQKYLEEMDSWISTAIREVIVSLSQQHKNTPSLGKRARSEHLESQEWERHCLCASLLRFWYEVLSEERLHTNTSQILSQSLNSILDLMSEEVFPELQLEVGRTIFALKTRAIVSHTNPTVEDRSLEVVLDYIEKNLFSRKGHILSSSPANAFTFYESPEKVALALWGLVIGRFLHTIEASVPIEQLRRLISFITGVKTAGSFAIEIETVIRKAFKSAYFWELPRLRECIDNQIEVQTAVFASIDAAPLMDAIVRGEFSSIKAQIMSYNITLAEAESASKMFFLMHHFPSDYTFKGSRADLVTRAVNADMYVNALNPDLEPMLHGVEWRAIFRSFISKSIKDANLKMAKNVGLTPAGMAYFTLSPQSQTPSSTYTASTLDLVSAIQLLSIQMAAKGDDLYMKNTLDYFMASDIFQGNRLFVQGCLMRFIQTLIDGFNPSSFSQDVLTHIHQLCTKINKGLEQTLSLVIQWPDDRLSSSENVIDAWHAFLSLRHWLGTTQSPSTTIINRQLFRRVVDIMKAAPTGRPTISDTFLATVFSTLVLEVQTILATEWNDISGVLAAYVYIVSSSPPAMEACRSVLSRACKSFLPIQYEHGLNFIGEMLEDDNEAISRLTTIIQLSSLCLREAPEKSAKVSYEHLSRCLCTFSDRPLFTSGSLELTGCTLEFIQCHFTDRAVALKPLEAMRTLLILSKVLIGCNEHNAHTSTSIFKSVVNILSVMVRLRRDLLSPLLPHLAMVLRQLMLLFRCVRPHLGGKQYRLVADTFPRWINPCEALGNDEARAFSRLLTALTTKYVTRGHDTHEQKASSMTRPFARHAPYVLLAYIQAMNDPLSIMAMPVRRELEPGLFALCTMMGEHGRDTLIMQSLDVGGKALLKDVWREYNKQRYTGRG